MLRALAPPRLTARERSALTSKRILVLSRRCADGVHHAGCSGDGCMCVCHAMAVHSATRRRDHHSV